MKRFILYVFAYILATVAATFGTVTVGNLFVQNNTSNSNQNQEIISPEEPSDGEKLLNSLLSVPTRDVSLSIDICGDASEASALSSNANNESQIKVAFDGTLCIADLSNVQVSGQVKVSIDGSNIELDIAYYNGTIFLSNETMNVKLHTSSILKVVEILPTLGLNLDLGLDLSNVDTSALMANFQNLKAQAQENGDLLLKFELMPGFVLNIYTDENYNIKSVNANSIKLSGNVINLFAGLAKSEKTIQDPDAEKTYVDVTKTFNVLDSVKEILTSKKFHFDINAALVGEYNFNLATTLDADFENELNFYTEISLAANNKTNNLKLGYIGQDAYISFANLNMMVEKSSVDSLLKIVSNLANIDLENSTIQSILQKIPNFELAKVLNKSLSSININNLLEFAKGEDNVVKVTVLGKALGISNDIVIVIKLDENEQFKELEINNIGILNSQLSINVAYFKEVNIPTLNKDDYTKIVGAEKLALAIVNTIKTIKQDKKIALGIDTTLNVNNNNVSLNGYLQLDFSNLENVSVYADVNATFMGKTVNIKIGLQNNDIYLIINNLKFKTTVSNLKSLTTKLPTITNDESIKNIIEIGFDSIESIKSIAKTIQNGFADLPENIIKSIATKDGEFNVSFDKDLLNAKQDFTAKIKYSNMLESIELSSLSLNNIGINFCADIVTKYNHYDFIAQQYSSLENIDYLLTAALSTIKDVQESQKIAFDINSELSVNNTLVQLQGSVVLSKTGIYANINANANDKIIPIELHLKDNKAYIKAQNLKIVCEIKELSDLVEKYTKNSDIAEIVENIIPTLNYNSIINGDLSSISLEIIKNIIIDKNYTKIIINGEFINNNDVEITLNYNDKFTNISISEFKFNNISANANINLNNNLTIPKLEENYNEVSQIGEFVDAITQTVNQLSSKKQIALTIDTKLNYNSKDIMVNGTLFVDFKSYYASKNLLDLSVYANINITIDSTNFGIQLWVDNGYAYLRYESLKVKIKIENIKDIIDTITDVLNVDINTNALNDVLKDTVIKQIIDGDYSQLSLDLVKDLSLKNNKLTIELSKTFINSLEDINLSLTFNDKIESLELAKVSISDISVALTAGINYNFVPAKLFADEYDDISGASAAIKSIYNSYSKIKTNKKINLNISDMHIDLSGRSFVLNGEIFVDFAGLFTEDNKLVNQSQIIKNLKCYANISLQSGEYSHNIKAILDGERIYLTYNTLNLSISVDNLQQVIDTISQLKFLSESLKTCDISNVKIADILEDAKQKSQAETSDFDITKVVKNIFAGTMIENVLNGDLSALDLSLLKRIAISNNKAQIVISKDIFNSDKDLQLELLYAEEIDGVSIKNMQISGIEMSGNVSIMPAGNIPQLGNIEAFVSLDSFKTAVNSALNTAIDVVDNKHISFGLQTQFTNVKITKNANDIPTKSVETYVELLPTSSAKFDWSNAYTLDGTKNKFVLAKMNAYINFEVLTTTKTYNYTNGVKDNSPARTLTNNHLIEIFYVDNVVYIRYNKMYVKINGESIELIVKTICEMLGIETNENFVDNVKDLISQTSDSSFLDSILQKARVEMIEYLSLSDTNFKVIANLSDLGLGIDALNAIKLDVDFDESRLNVITIKDLKLLDNTIDNVKINLQDYSPIPNVSQGDYINLSGIGDMLVAIKNTMQFKDFEFAGDINLKLNVIGINLDWKIPVNAKIKLYENGNFDAQIKLGAIPVITGVNDDAPYKFGNTVDGIYPGLDRILNIYIKDNMVYFHRTEKIPVFIASDRNYQKKLKVHIETLLDDPLYYILQYGMGFSSKIMTAIKEAVYKDRVNPIDYSNILKGFEASNNYYALTLNLKELAENDKLDTMTLGIKTTLHNQNLVIGGIMLGMFMPVASNVEITLNSDNLSHINIGQTLDMSNVSDYATTYPYAEGAEWDAYNDDWQQSGQRKFTLNYETNCDVKINSVEGIAGSQITLPSLDTYTVNSDVDFRTYIFDGWYTTKTFDKDTKYTENVMPRKDTTLYAKWNVTILKYITISFVTNGGEAIDDLKVLEGSNISLPTYLDELVIQQENQTIVKQFEGWFTDENLSTQFVQDIAPTSNLVLYAKWTVVDCTQFYLLNIFDNGEKIYSKRVAENKCLELSGDKFKDSTLYYLDSNYSQKIADITSFVMPNSDLSIYIRNQYIVKVLSETGNTVNNTYVIYQGDKVEIVSQNSKETDVTENGKKVRRDYNIFEGYYANSEKIDDINNYVCPNVDVEIIAHWNNYSKNYFTVTLSKETGHPSIAYTKYISVPKTSVQVLDGETLKLDSSYTPTWEYTTGKLIKVNWYYTFCGWSQDKDSLDGKNAFYEIVVTGNITLYASWSTGVKKK